MTRDDGWRLLGVGRHIERLAFLANALSSGLGTELLDLDGGFEAMLSLFDSTITFRAQYQQSRNTAALVSLVVLDRDNPFIGLGCLHLAGAAGQAVRQRHGSTERHRGAGARPRHLEFCQPRANRGCEHGTGRAGVIAATPGRIGRRSLPHIRRRQRHLFHPLRQTNRSVGT